MTLFIEPYRKPHEHMMVVQSFLLLESKRSEQIYFVSTKDYFESIPDYCKSDVQFIELNNISCSSFSMIFRIFYLVFKYSKIIKPKRLILLSSKSYSSFLIKLWSFFLLKKLKVYVLLHGELQYLIKSDTLSKKLDSTVNKFNLFFNSFIISRFKFIVLSNLVYQNLCAELGMKLNNIRYLDLPYDYTDIFNQNILVEPKEKLVLSTIGVNALNKNSHYLNLIADKLIDQINLSKLELRCVGRVDDVVFNKSIHLLNFEGSYFIDPVMYSKLIIESDFILSFVDDENYSLVSSGSYFDCIKYQKPILALKNSQWEYNFQKFGEIGVLFNSVYEMADYIFLILKNREKVFQFTSKLKDAMLLSGINNNVEYYLNIIK